MTRLSPPKPCVNCNRPSKPLRHGRCHSCNEYVRRHGIERPYRDDGRREMPSNTRDRLNAAKSGPLSVSWKGDLAVTHTKRDRTRRAFPLDVCERCGEPATEHHHRDRDVGNNTPDNIECLCDSCHKIAHQSPIRSCAVCGVEGQGYAKGLCHTCYEYRRRTGRDAPMHARRAAETRRLRRISAGQLEMGVY